MYDFISLLNDKGQMQEQIIKQSRLGFFGYFLKKMFFNDLDYYKGAYVNKKKALEIITPRQSLFLIARTDYDKECLPLLEIIYGDIPTEILQRHGLKDVNCCISFGNIYVTEEDTDVALKTPGLLRRFIRRFSNSRMYNIYLPPKYSKAQLEELNKVIKVRKDFKRCFFKDEIEVRHYKDFEMTEVDIYEGKQALRFIENEINKGDKNENLVNKIKHPDEFVFNLEEPKKRNLENTFVEKAKVNHDMPSRENSSTVVMPSQSEPCK